MDIQESIIYGIFVCDFNVKIKFKSIPYQLTIERDLYFNRSNIHLINFINLEDNEVFCPEIRHIVTKCIDSFFQKNPKETVYFEMDLSHRRNYTKFLKFYRWSKCCDKYEFTFAMTDKNDLKYVEVNIIRL